MLKVENLSGGYGRVIALRSIDLVVSEGETVAVIGRNGAGKSTLLKTISGLSRAFSGRIFFMGNDITRLQPPARVRAGIAHIPEGRQVFDTLSVEDNLRLGAYYRGTAETGADLDENYDLFPVLKERRDSLAGALSGGQQQMLALGRGLMAGPRLLMLDEPSMGLAPQLVSQIFQIIGELKNRGTTILLVEQNARRALTIADRAYVLDTGRVVIEGEASDLMQNEKVKTSYLGG